MQELFLTPSEAKLRLFKSLGSFARALGFFTLSKKELESSDVFSAAVNLYYSLFHLAVATLVMSKRYKFDFEREFVLPDCSNLRTNKAKRLTQLSHRELLRELQETGKSNDYAYRVFLTLETARQLRECFSYGPYIWIFKERIVENSRHWIKYRPIFHSEEFTITPEQPRKFNPIKDRVNKTMVETINLVGEFSNFMKPIMKWLAGYDEIEARIDFYLFAINQTIYLRPFIPFAVFLEAQQMAEKFCKDIGEKYLESFLKGKDFSNRKEFIEKLEQGSLFILRLEMPKDFLTQLCTHCWRVIPKGVEKCPYCGMPPYLELQ